MSDILFVKTSSLGDVIHHLPALTEARRHRPHAHLSWAVEEAYAPLLRLHPAIDEVIPVAVRAWRRAALRPATWSAMRQARRMLTSRAYECIVDTQGLLKSALIARTARGVRHGYDTESITERLASRFYDVRHRVSRERHAVDRNRALTALALGYAADGPPDYGLDRVQLAAPAQSARRYAVLLHATAHAGKQWPEPHWHALAAALGNSFDPVLPWGDPAERARSERIAHATAQALVPERQPLDAVARLIAGAELAIGVDTGLLHLAAALGVPTVAIFCGSDPGLTQPVGAGPIAVLGASGRPPTVEAVLEAAARLRVRAAAP